MVRSRPPIGKRRGPGAVGFLCGRSAGPRSVGDAPPGTYRPRGTSSIQGLFRSHFTELTARYEVDYARRLGRFCLERITKAVDRFLDARIQCSNPSCKAEYFRPFNCKVFYP
jgi:hypothetical protein